MDITSWLNAQIGRSRADVLSAAKLMAVETKNAVKQSQKGGRAVRGRVSLNTRSEVSAATKADARIRAFFNFARSPDKRPIGVTAVDWALCHQIAAGWVERGDVAANLLASFKK